MRISVTLPVGSNNGTIGAMSDLVVVKIGGSTLGQHDTAMEDIAALQAAGRPLVVVHGGGSAATEWLKVHGVTSEFVDGLRVTGPDAIDVVVAVFAGLVNKQIVAGLIGAGRASLRDERRRRRPAVHATARRTPRLRG